MAGKPIGRETRKHISGDYQLITGSVIKPPQLPDHTVIDYASVTSSPESLHQVVDPVHTPRTLMNTIVLALMVYQTLTVGQIRSLVQDYFEMLGIM